MPVKIPPAQIQNLQQIEAVVVGPDESNRLLIIDGQFDVTLQAVSEGQLASQKEIEASASAADSSRPLSWPRLAKLVTRRKSSFNQEFRRTVAGAGAWRISIASYESASVRSCLASLSGRFLDHHCMLQAITTREASCSRLDFPCC